MMLKRCLFSTYILINLLFGLSVSAQDDWTLAKDTDGIKVYTRPREGSPLHEFRGEVEINVAPDKVEQLLRKADVFQQWMPDVAESRLLKANENEQLHYLDNSAPWPVANRDGVYHFRYAHNVDGSITISVKAVPEYVPKRSGKVRIPQANGEWKVIPTATGVKVSYQLHAAPGGRIPNWLANETVVTTPYKTLKALRDQLTPSNSTK